MKLSKAVSEKLTMGASILLGDIKKSKPGGMN